MKKKETKKENNTKRESKENKNKTNRAMKQAQITQISWSLVRQISLILA